MKFIEFFPNFNCPMTFLVKDEDVPRIGVVFDSIPKNGQKHVHYIFVPEQNLKAWRMAFSISDVQTMESLQSVINIEDIIEVERGHDIAIRRAVSNVIKRESIPDSLAHLYEKQKGDDGLWRIVRK